MAGYMTALQGYVYEGELVNGESQAIANGMLVAPKMVSGELKMGLPAKDANTKLLCKEVTTIYDGMPAYRFIVTALGNKTYFVENGFEVNSDEVYDTTLYETASGKYLRAHPLLVGEEFVTDQVTGTPVVGTEYGVLATGKIGVAT